MSFEIVFTLEKTLIFYVKASNTVKDFVRNFLKNYL